MMKRLLALLLFTSAFVWGVGEAKGQDITQSERDQLIAKLEKSRKDVEAATKGLTPAQLSFKPNIFRWSVADCVEHIALTEDFLFASLQRVMTAPAQTTQQDQAAVAQTDKAITTMVANRSSKFMAPEPVRPAHHAPTEDLLKQFAASRSRTIEFVKTTHDLRSHCAASPLGKCTDAYQWLLLMAGHSDRHLAQLMEVKADPKFPKQ